RVRSQQLAEEMTHWFLNLEPIGKDVTLTVEGGMNRPPYQKDAGISALFEKAQAIYREIGKELLDVPLTGGGSDGNFTAALGIPTLDGLGADGKGAHAAYEQIYFSSLMPRTYLCARLLETLDSPNRYDYPSWQTGKGDRRPTAEPRTLSAPASWRAP